MSSYEKTIYEIPPVPTAIKEAVNNDSLAVFIGAGVSRIIGCMGWRQLANNLINVCFNTKNKQGTSTCINFKEKETLSQNNDHKKTITICHYILKENGLEELFFSELNNAFEIKKKEEKQKDGTYLDIYKELYGLRGLFITTNADKHFDDKFAANRIIYNIEAFDKDTIDRTKLYHIHGCQDKRDSLIFTVPQYIHRYNHKGFRKFLYKVFNHYTVLFVGYGMSEFELLDFLITKFDNEKDSDNQPKELKHFILKPFYKGEENILSFDQFYYNQMGIQVIGFEKDERGHSQLYEVIKHWNKEINMVSTYLLNSFREIEDIVGGL